MTKQDLDALNMQNEQRRLSREELLGPRRVRDEIEVEGLGGSIVIQTLSNLDRQDIRRHATGVVDESGKFVVTSAKDGGELDDERFKLLAICKSVVEPDLTFEDVDALNQQDSAVIDELELKIGALNLMGKQGEAKKESSETPSSDSDLSSQNGSE